MTIKDWITQNATLKDTAKIEDLDKLIGDLDYMKNVKTVDEARAFILRSDILKKALDKETQERVDSHDKNFKEKELPNLEKEIRDKITEELNPAETPEQKRIREMELKLDQKEKKEALNELKKALREKAREIGADPIKAEKYHVYGDDALSVMEKEFTETKSYIDSEIERISKERFKGQSAPHRSDEPDSTHMKRSDFDALDNKAKHDFIKSGGKTID